MPIVLDPFNEPVEIAPGRGDLNQSSIAFDSYIGSPFWQGRPISYAKMFATQPWVAVAVMRLLTWSIRVPLKVYRRIDDDHVVRLRPPTTRSPPPSRRRGTAGHMAELTMALLGPLLVHGNDLTDVQDGAGGQLRFDPLDWRRRPAAPRRHRPGLRDPGLARLAGRDARRAVRRHGHAPEVVEPARPDRHQPARAGPLVVLSDTAAIEWAMNSLANGFKPTGVVELDEYFLGRDPAERQVVLDQARKDITRAYGGPLGAGGLPVFPAGVKLNAGQADHRRRGRAHPAAPRLPQRGRGHLHDPAAHDRAPREGVVQQHLDAARDGVHRRARAAAGPHRAEDQRARRHRPAARGRRLRRVRLRRDPARRPAQGDPGAARGDRVRPAGAERGARRAQPAAQRRAAADSCGCRGTTPADERPAAAEGQHHVEHGPGAAPRRKRTERWAPTMPRFVEPNEYTSWAVRPEVLPAVARRRPRAAERTIEREQLEAHSPPASSRVAEARPAGGRRIAGQGAVQVISLRGLITPRASLFSLLFGYGGGGLQSFREIFDEAVASTTTSARSSSTSTRRAAGPTWSPRPPPRSSRRAAPSRSSPSPTPWPRPPPTGSPRRPTRSS
jgi:hypothetical protein